MISRLSVALIVSAITVACAGGEGTAAWQGTTTDSAGVTIVQNPTTGLWGPDDAWTFAETLRIGTAEGEPEYQFGSIAGASSLGIASDGRIVVLDQQAQHIKVFTPSGEYERTIGGPGSGPGEIGPGASAVIIAPGDTLLLSDVANQRGSLYLLDGTYLRSFPLNFADGIPFRWEQSRDGQIMVQTRRLAFPGSTAPPDSMDVISVRNLDGSIGDTVMSVRSGGTVSFAGGAPEWNLFSPEPLWALYQDQVLYAVNDNYRIGMYGADGTLQRVIQKPFTRDPVTDGDQDAIKELFQKLFVAQGVPPQMASQLMTRVHFAENYPAFGQMIAGPRGTILVQLVQPLSKLSEKERESFNIQAGDLGSRTWDVFDEQGQYLGPVTMPLRFQPIQFRGDEIYGIQRDDLDVQYIVKLRVSGS